MISSDQLAHEQKVILILSCADCGTELDRTKPLTEKQAARARVASGLSNAKCPKGCRSTFSDCNWNTRITEIPA